MYWLQTQESNDYFPPVEQALHYPNGLLAAGGNLHPECLIDAYAQGIFPWYNVGQPILWWSPDPRMVLYPARLHVSRSLHKTLRRSMYTITFDTAFQAVISGCAELRDGQQGTWITPEMKEAYCRLHNLGFAHSVEVWHTGALVGGLYGVTLGKVFFAESMFTRCKDASKIALVFLVRQLKRWGYYLIDCQVESPHLVSLGAENIPRQKFIGLLQRWCKVSDQSASWRLDAATNNGHGR